VISDNHNANLALARDAMCLWYGKYSDEQCPADRVLFEAAETKVREDRRGS